MSKIYKASQVTLEIDGVVLRPFQSVEIDYGPIDVLTAAAAIGYTINEIRYAVVPRPLTFAERMRAKRAGRDA